MPDISNVQKSPFLKAKTEKGRRKYQKEGRASRQMYEIYISVDKIQKYI